MVLFCARRTMPFTEQGIQSDNVLYNMAIISQFKQGCHTRLDRTVLIVDGGGDGTRLLGDQGLADLIAQ